MPDVTGRTRHSLKVEVNVDHVGPGRHRGTHIYVFGQLSSRDGETLTDVERRRRAAVLGLSVVDAEMGTGFATRKLGWRSKLGCFCGCSPGFVITDAPALDVYVTITQEDSYWANGKLQPIAAEPAPQPETENVSHGS